MSRRIVSTLCAVCLLLALPAAASAETSRALDFSRLIDGFLQFLAANDTIAPIDDTVVVGTGGCPVSVTCGGGVTISCTGTSCVKEDGRCVKCGKTAQFCPGTTGTNCGTTSSQIDFPVWGVD